jgi:hypothetical protein
MNQFLKVNEELGLVFGFAIVCKVNGEPYFDTQGDHIPEDAMLKASTDYMLESRESKDMHVGESVQQTVFAMPITEDTSKAFGFDGTTTGLLTAIKPTPDILEKYRNGTYTGFSIGGSRGVDEDEDGNVLKVKVAALDKKSPNSEETCKAKTKRIMRSFHLAEISTVDRPAQEPAVAALMKWAVDEPYLMETIAKLMVLTSTAEDHQHGVELRSWTLEEGGGTTSYAGGEDSKGHSHSFVINGEGTVTISENQGHTHEADLTAIIQHMMMAAAVDKAAETEQHTTSQLAQSDYALVRDPNAPATWDFQISKGGRADRRLIGQCVQRLTAKRHRELRKLSVDDRATVIGRIRRGWVEAHPNKPVSHMPSVLKRAHVSS